ncbi:polysaccharide deacetylase-like protein, partial [Fulvivirga sp. RKSG066]|uniref:polysaccharide deacetylase family protein n=1 Tax=Fulvivirga aurantia TaxID=2529383 RepID=UPI0012BD76B1
MKALKSNYFLTIICLVIFTSLANSQQKKVCITIDDLPFVSYRSFNIDFVKQQTDSLIKTLVKYDVPAIGYVNESKLYESQKLDSGRVALLEMWLSNGLELGNHTFSHPNYHLTSYEQFTQDIL